MQMIVRRVIQKINYYLFYATAIPLVTATVLTAIDVSGRYFRRPFLGAMEISQLSLVLIVALGLAHTQARKGHIDIDMFYNRMSPRARDITDLVTTFMSLVFVSLMAWRMIPWIQSAMNMMEWTMLLHWPTWPFKSMVFIGLLCLSLQLLLDLVDRVKKLSKKAPIPAESEGRLMD